MARIKPIRVDEYELAQIRYEENSYESSWSVEKRINGCDQFSDGQVRNVRGYKSDKDWTQDAQ